MFGECHAHIIMDGVNYQKAIALHKDKVNEDAIRRNLKAYQELGITFVRDGGDALGVSKRAKMIAKEYGIDYRTPVFAIHKNGHYGSIVGKGFNNIKEYGEVVSRPKALGDIRGVSYIYAMFYRFGLIDVPEKVKGKMDLEK